MKKPRQSAFGRQKHFLKYTNFYEPVDLCDFD